MAIIKKIDFSLYPSLIVFFSSFCLMVIELVAGRIMAPYLGVSLYTWTSIIGVILGGISIGNYLGGRIADKTKPEFSLGLIFLLAALFSVMIIFLSFIVGDFLKNTPFHLLLSTLFFSFFVFFPPSVLLSCITPIVIKSNLKDLTKTGRTVGRIYAFSALGSILGTFATGYFLISFLGTRLIIFIISLLLFLFGLDFIGWELFKKTILKDKKTFFLLFFLIIIGFLMPVPCKWESNYYCIDLVSYQDSESGKTAIALRLDNLIHSYITKGDPNYLGYEYEKIFAILAEYQKKEDNFDLLFLGGGGYVLPKYLENNYKMAKLDVIEIDPKVTKINYQYLGLVPTTTIVTYNEDARIFLDQLDVSKKYDIIYGDTFNDLSVPYHLTTYEFNQKIKAHLKPAGYYAVNVIDNIKIGSFLSSCLNTLSKTFAYVYLAPADRKWAEAEKRNTYVILAGNQPINLSSWGQASKKMTENKIVDEKKIEDVNFLADSNELNNFLASAKKVLLTDDYVPVDNLLAPIFADKFLR